MFKVAIVGAGSIGNHLTYSCRKLGWSVAVFDIDPTALLRLKNEIYPARYGKFDNEIQLLDLPSLELSPVGFFDLIIIGTPPDTHYEIAQLAFKLKPKICFIEKPACQPNLKVLKGLESLFKESATKFVVGYNHRVSHVVVLLLNLLKTRNIGQVFDLSVNWLESWTGILKAHPWLNSPSDSYLGYSNRGGGALFEHSHGLDLWLFISNHLQLGCPERISSSSNFHYENGVIQYDKEIQIEITTDTGFTGRVVQDILTEDVDKSLVLDSEFYIFKLEFGTGNKADSLEMQSKVNKSDRLFFEITKSRPNDFDEEMLSLIGLIKNSDENGCTLLSPPGIETALVATAALFSAQESKIAILDLEAFTFSELV